MEPHAQQWEFRREASPDAETLTAAGAGGWELVAIEPGDGTYVFKRPAMSLRERVTLEQKERVYRMRARLREAEA